MNFSDLNLNASLLKALSGLGYTTPTVIQGKAFSVVMSGQDVLGIAQTGTGKTFAYLLPLLRQWKYTKERHPQIIILVPTRELVVQVEKEAQKLTSYMNTVTLGVYGGTNIKTHIKAVMEGADIIVATPGRLLDLALNGSLRLKSVKKLVLDEVDEMLGLGFRSQLTRILDLLPEKRQNLLFSATITEEVETFMEEHFTTPVKVEAAPVGTPLENISQSIYHVPNFYTKVNLLEQLLSDEKEFEKVLVFVGTKSLADMLHKQIDPKFPDKVGVIHSNKDQNYRFNAVRNFQKGDFRILIATDLIARGIDISDVTHVINFDTPDEPENYIHRIGRTGRAEKQGKSITLTTEREQEYLDAIEALMSYSIPRMELPEGLEISTELIPDEMPKIHMKNVEVKLPKRENVGLAFHEKKEKNKKVNMHMTRGAKMKQKYKKPKTRGQKKKR